MLGIHVTLCGACVIIVDLLVLLPVTWCAGYRHLDRWEHVSGTSRAEEFCLRRPRAVFKKFIAKMFRELKRL